MAQPNNDPPVIDLTSTVDLPAAEMATDRTIASKKQRPEAKKYVAKYRRHGGARLTIHGCDFARTFDVVVGSPPNQQTFTLHHDVMTQRSKYFAAARSGRWNEKDPDKPTDLQHEDPEVFKNYLHCAYFDRVGVEGLEIDEEGRFVESAASDEKMREEYHTEDLDVEFRHTMRIIRRFSGLMKVYLLANMLLDYKTANMVVDETIRSFVLLRITQPGADVVHLIHDNTLPGDGMRHFWADWYVHNVKTLPFGNLEDDDDDDDDDDRPWPNDFLGDLVKGLQERQEVQRINNVPRLCFRIQEYFETWHPADGPHRYHSGPGTEGNKLPDSDDEDPDYEPSEPEAVMTDDEMVE